ncbi:putative hydrogenase expression/formation protein MJ0676 [Proteiniborus sp. DW1]|uniref:AIR synthase family protein n=1 Tax=Proteiniborus sp. DW1 TaxID=1889883 RepID=UPI00092DEC52|nr:AIR synthase family protein [Proteiniborus sp. DW1]SCG82089.1 putative hydrogenase expression/formation protein MJ0676 [Proteiniborus sp. DW1]
MKIGKLPNELLEKIVFSNISRNRNEVLTRAGIGKDCAVLDFGENVCVVSTDPITGTVKDIGKLAVHISCNDVASNGAEPVGLLMTILAPPSSTEEDIKKIMEDANEAASELNVEIIGGHTEVTDTVNRIIVSTTVLGMQAKKNMLDPERVKVGDKILITKSAGIEGTAIIAKELEEKLINSIPQYLIDEGKSLMENISIVTEGIICGHIGVPYMHDITEGGVFGAVWETGVATKKGVKINIDAIPLKESTREICNVLSINPYKLISSGSLIVVSPVEKVDKIQKELYEKGIEASVIGEITEGNILVEIDGELKEIEPPDSDELYKVI